MTIILFSLSIILIFFGIITAVVNISRKQSYKKSIIITIIGILLLAYIILMIPINFSKSGNPTK